MRDIQSFVCGDWVGPDSSARGVFDAVDGSQIGVAGSLGFDRAAMVDYAKSVSGLRGHWVLIVRQWWTMPNP